MCSGCGAPLASGGTLCVRCGTQNAVETRAQGEREGAVPARPTVPLLGFRHPRDSGSTLVKVVVILVVLFVAASVLAYLLY
jgi:hypothetical protein